MLIVGCRLRTGDCRLLIVDCAALALAVPAPCRSGPCSRSPSLRRPEMIYGWGNRDVQSSALPANSVTSGNSGNSGTLAPSHALGAHSGPYMHSDLPARRLTQDDGVGLYARDRPGADLVADSNDCSVHD